MMKDIIIIGGGPAGNAAALAARAAGAGSVLLIERDSMGGTCTNRGCIPTKLLLSRSAHLAANAGAGGGSRTDWGRLLAHKRALVKGLTRSIGARCRGAGVEIVEGTAAFAGPTAVEVRASDGSVAVHEARRILVAAGSAPAELPGAPADGRVVITSDEALELEEVPSSLLVVGSGAVGSEFATIFRNFGSRVTIVEAADRLFPGEDPAVGEAFRKIWEQAGVEVVTGDPVDRVDTRDGIAQVSLRSGARLETERVLVGVGRRLLGRELACERAGVQIDERGAVVVGEGHRTTAEGIFAAGDVTGRMLLAHVATAEGEAAARSALGAGGASAIPYGSIPWASFTTPEVGSVGIHEEAAAARGIGTVTGTAAFMDNIKSRIDRETEGFVKLVARRDSGKLIGATIVGSHASEAIHFLALAIHAGMTAGDIEGFVHLHPSASETIADAVYSLKDNLLQ